MPNQTVYPQIDQPTVITGDGMQIPLAWGGKAGGISFNKIAIPPGLTLHKIVIHYSKNNGIGSIDGFPIHTTYVMPNAAFAASGIAVENVPTGGYSQSKYISYIDLSNINSFMNEQADNINKITQEESIIDAAGALYAADSWVTTNTFYVKNAETVDAKDPS